MKLSLRYLKQFPIDTLRVDQLFVREIAAEKDDATIVNAVINISRGLKHRVIAGVCAFGSIALSH
jgi:EAL domain-containing protein (putative c-di-GMP-specific phosphodiesterase class I)